MLISLKLHLFSNIFGDTMAKIYLLPVNVVDKGVMDFLVRGLSSIWLLDVRHAVAVPVEACLK
jgi:hypothetical protein